MILSSSPLQHKQTSLLTPCPRRHSTDFRWCIVTARPFTFRNIAIAHERSVGDKSHNRLCEKAMPAGDALRLCIPQPSLCVTVYLPLYVTAPIITLRGSGHSQSIMGPRLTLQDQEVYRVNKTESVNSAQRSNHISVLEILLSTKNLSQLQWQLFITIMEPIAKSKLMGPVFIFASLVSFWQK